MRPTWCCGRCPETTSGGVDCTCAENPRCKGPLCACGHSALTDLRDALARKHAATIYRGARKVGGEPLAWETLSKHDQLSVYALMDPLLPIIAAHEAEVVGSVFDRIDALHVEHRDTHPDLAKWITRPWFCCVRVQLGGIAETDCNACGEPHPCPTRRLTAEIRGEMSHD